MRDYKERDIALFFILVQTMLFFYFSYDKTVFLRPQSQHQWRQCDGSSFALMYYHEGNSLFFPKTHNLSGKDGNTIGEFPIIYYFESLLFKLFGYKEYILKLTSYIIFITGLWFLNKLIFYKTRNILISIILVALTASFPLVTFYAITTLPNISAFTFNIIAFYYLVQYIDNEKNKDFFLVVLAFSLVGLLKPTFLIPFASIIAAYTLSKIMNNDNFKIDTKKMSILIISPILILSAWLIWVRVYINKYSAAPFLFSIKPIWKRFETPHHEIWRRIIDEWWNITMYKPILWMALIMLIYIILSNSKRVIKYFILSSILAVFTYFTLFFHQFYHHDYYFIEAVVVLMIIISIFCIHFISTYYRFRHFLYLVLIIITYKNIAKSKEINTYRYSHSYNWDDFYNDFFDLGIALKAKGVKYTDKVIVAEDYSFTNSLYLMDQIGWTELNKKITYNTVLYYKKQGAKYFICTESYFIQNKEYSPLSNSLYLKHKNLLIFKI